MTPYEIVPATLSHATALRDRLREKDRRECVGQNGSVRRALHQAVRRSLYSNAVLLDGTVIAMWGLGGAMLGDEGHPWFLTAPEVERFPMAMVREARYAAEEMLACRPFLWNYVLADYPQAVKFVSVVGFSLDPPLWKAPNGDAYRRFWMRE